MENYVWFVTRAIWGQKCVWKKANHARTFGAGCERERVFTRRETRDAIRGPREQCTLYTVVAMDINLISSYITQCDPNAQKLVRTPAPCESIPRWTVLGSYMLYMDTISTCYAMRISSFCHVIFLLFYRPLIHSKPFAPIRMDGGCASNMRSKRSKVSRRPMVALIRFANQVYSFVCKWLKVTQRQSKIHFFVDLVIKNRLHF